MSVWLTLSHKWNDITFCDQRFLLMTTICVLGGLFILDCSRLCGLIFMYGLIDIFSNWPISLITNWSTLVLISGTAQNKSQVEPVSECTHHLTCCPRRREKRTVILKHLWICSRNRLTHFLITRRRRDVTVCCVWLGVRLHYLCMLNSLLRF